MSGLSGRKGKVTVDDDAAAGLASWNLSIKNPAINVVQCDEDFDRNIASGVISADGTIVVHYDPDDATQEAMSAALLAGTAVSLKLYPEGIVASKKFWTISALLTEEKESGAPKDKIGREYTFTTAGAAPARSAVPA